MGFLGHRVVCLFLVFNGVSILFSIAAVSIYIPTNSARGFPFLHTLSSIYCLERVRISTYVSRTAFWVPQMGRYLKVRSSRTCLGQSPWRGSWGSSLLDSWMITSTVTPESLLLAKKQREKKKDFFYWCACVPSSFSCVQLFATPWILLVACQAPLSMGFSKQEYWSGLPCPSPGDLLNPGIEPRFPVSSALQADSLPPSHWGNPPPSFTDIWLYT